MRAARLVCAVCTLALLAIAAIDPRAAGAAWRAAFVIAGAVPAGAIALLLIARLTGAAWAPALVPLAAPAPLLVPALLGVAADQWLRPSPPHLAMWLSPVPLLVRGVLACGLWWWLSRRLRGAGLGIAGTGLALLAHAAALALVAPDWLLGVAPGQPFSAIALLLGAGQILGACAAAAALRLGDIAARRDLARLMLAGALGVAYLAYVDYLIVWYGNLPARIGYYAVRSDVGWGPVVLVALGIGLLLPIAAVAAGGEARWRIAGGAALLGWALLVAWLVLPGDGVWAAAALPLAIGIAAALPFAARGRR